MKYCPKCSEQYPDSSAFCGNDGSPLKGAEGPSTETSDGYCKACGEKVEPDTLFCPGCGAKVYTQKSLDSFHRSDTGEEERRFTLGKDESLKRTLEAEKTQQAGINRNEGLPSRGKLRRGLYAAGGAVVVAALVVVFWLSGMLDYWRASGPSGVPSVPSSAQSPAPQPPPLVAEPSPVPNPQGSTAAAPPLTERTEQPPGAPSPENPAAVVSEKTTPPSKPARHPSKRSVPRESELAAKKEPIFPPLPESAKTGESASLKETPIPRRPAEAGTYETVRMAMARRDPSDSGEIVDQIKPRTRLTVTGSQGDWLVVYSKTKNRTVYIKRDDAMFISEKSSAGQSGKDSEVRWKEIENQIQRAISNQGITGVSVSFIRDTAYLKGTVKTENQRFTAEQAARSFPEVIYIYNGIWVNP